MEHFRKEDETLEPLLAGRGYILQKRGGYRFSLDAVVLAYFVTRLQADARFKKGIHYIDLGTGCGIVPVLLGKWKKDLKGYGVEIQEPMADMARRNLQIHDLQARMQILCMDLREIPSHIPGDSFDWVTTNPPYRSLNTGRVNPDPEKALARHEVAATRRDICGVMAYLLRKRGRAFWVYPASRAAGLMADLREAGLEPKTLRPVYPKPGERARRVLVEAVCKGKEDLTLEEPLVVEQDYGNYSEEIERVFRWDF
jgi:tRNA1Val (adenine37-N6)-methyltransferase